MSEAGDIYADLRDQVLSVQPSDVGLTPTASLQGSGGALMDMSYPEAAATLVGLSDGTTSLYTRSGGGVIGAGEHDAVVAATLRWLGLAEDLLPTLERRDDTALPPVGHVAVTILAYDGRYSATAAETALGSASSPLTPLFAAGHDVITELRQVAEQRE